jgi:predicted DNA-binding transcriptional regulator AlpA
MVNGLDKTDILDIGDCAQLLGISKRSMYSLVSQQREPGKIFGKIVARKWKVHRSEIEKFLTEEQSSIYQMRLNLDNKNETNQK